MFLSKQLTLCCLFQIRVVFFLPFNARQTNVAEDDLEPDQSVLLSFDYQDSKAYERFLIGGQGDIERIGTLAFPAKFG